jgi:hypothetical protein
MNVIDEQGYLPVHYAIKSTNHESIRLLVNAGCALPYKMPQGNLLLLMAQESCSRESVHMIVRGIAERHEDLRQLSISRLRQTIQDEDMRACFISALQYNSVFDELSSDIIRLEGLFNESYPLPSRLLQRGPQQLATGVLAQASCFSHMLALNWLIYYMKKGSEAWTVTIHLGSR